MGALEFAPSLRRSIRRYFALAWELPDGGWAALNGHSSAARCYLHARVPEWPLLCAGLGAA